MSERGSEPESYLSEIDRRLETIEGELQPGRARPNQSSRRRGRAGPLAAILGRTSDPPAAPERVSDPAAGAQTERIDPPAQSHSDPSGLIGQVRAMTDLQAKLIAAIEDLIDACAPAATGGEPTAGSVTVSAGPFRNTGAVRAFAERLRALPGVREVSISGYEGADRALLDVELDGESPPTVTP